jgi:hypothetical protein
MHDTEKASQPAAAPAPIHARLLASSVTGSRDG